MPDPLSQLALHMWLLLPPLLMLMTRQVVASACSLDARGYNPRR